MASLLREWGIETHTSITGTIVVDVLRCGDGPRSISLRACRGEDFEAIDGAQLVVWDQTENRMHVQKALMEFLLLGQL